MNEIITFGANYKLTPGIQVFVKSAKAVCDNVTVIAINLQPDVVDFLTKNNVNIIDGVEIAKKYKVDLSISPYTLKVIFFYLYSKHYCQSTNLYLCDFTDLFFQKDIFELVKSDKTYVSSENKKIKDCETNTTWLNICYNQDILNLLANDDILNGGSILGKRDACISTLLEMCNDMGSIISRVGNYQNIDQASLNKVVRFDEYNFNILSNFEIFNSAHFGNATLGRVGNVITMNGYEPYIIHQYDVIKPLEHQLYAKFAK